MTASSWGWKRTTSDRSPTHEGDVERYKRHQLHAIVGIFEEQLVWRCSACGIERNSTKYIYKKCQEA